MKTAWIAITLLLFGCRGPTAYEQIRAERLANFQAANWPLMEPEFARLDDLGGHWIECTEEEFPSKARWSGPAELDVVAEKVVLRFRRWPGASDREVESYLLNLMPMDWTRPPRPAPRFKAEANDKVSFEILRKQVYITGGRKESTDYLSLGLFDPPLRFRRSNQGRSTP